MPKPAIAVILALGVTHDCLNKCWPISYCRFPPCKEWFLNLLGIYASKAHKNKLHSEVIVMNTENGNSCK